MRAYAHELIRTHRAPGVVLDTNLLLLLLVGTWHIDRVEAFKRTRSHFLGADHTRLTELLLSLDRLTTTVGILTEVSNLAGQLEGRDRGSFYDLFARSIHRLDIRDVPTAATVGTPEFRKYGLTDAGIIILARSGHLILTIDFPLSNYLATSQLAALNYNHLNVVSIDEAAWR